MGELEKESYTYLQLVMKVIKNYMDFQLMPTTAFPKTYLK